MANELHDPTMLTWTGSASSPVFHVNPTLDVVWMDASTLAAFFLCIC